MKYLLTLLTGLLRLIEIILILLFLLIEEVLWVRIGLPIYNHLRKIRLLQRFEDYMQTKMNQWLLFIIFLIPFILMEVLGIWAGKMFVTGNFIGGVLLYIAKGFCTPLVVFVFNAGKPKLLNFKIVAGSYRFILWLKQTEIYQSVINRMTKIKKVIKGYLKSIKGERSLFALFKVQIAKTYCRLRKMLRRPL